MNPDAKILIVDDDEDNARILEHFLKRVYANVVVTDDGSKALELLAQESYLAVFTDWMMPEMDGAELIRKIRREIQPAPLIVMMSAKDKKRARQQALQFGADDFFGKPFNPQDVASFLEKCLEKQKCSQPSKPTE